MNVRLLWRALSAALGKSRPAPWRALELPPVIDLLLDETQIITETPEAFLDSVKKLLPELRQRAEFSMREWEYYGQSSIGILPGFKAYVSGGMDPFSATGKCYHSECRLRSAKNLALSIGLYTDVTVLMDQFTGQFENDRDLGEGNLVDLGLNVLLLRVYRPLLQAGVVRFSSPSLDLCEEHYREFIKQTSIISGEVLQDFGDQIRIRLEGDYLDVDLGGLYEPHTSILMCLDDAEKNELSHGASAQTVGMKRLTENLRREAANVLMGIRQASSIKAVTFSNSRFALYAARAADSLRSPFDELEVWETGRSTRLPWIKDLSLEQLLIVREEAKDALPRFRARLLRHLTNTDEQDISTVSKVIADLNNEAHEVEAELKSLNLKYGERFRTVGGLLGTTISVYGFANDILAPGIAMGGLVTLLGLIHGAARKDRQERDKLRCRPGYVLVRAKELLEHSA